MCEGWRFSCGQSSLMNSHRQDSTWARWNCYLVNLEMGRCLARAGAAQYFRILLRWSSDWSYKLVWQNGSNKKIKVSTRSRVSPSHAPTRCHDGSHWSTEILCKINLLTYTRIYQNVVQFQSINSVSRNIYTILYNADLIKYDKHETINSKPKFQNIFVFLEKYSRIFSFDPLWTIEILRINKSRRSRDHRSALKI